MLVFFEKLAEKGIGGKNKDDPLEKTNAKRLCKKQFTLAMYNFPSLINIFK